MVKNGIFLIVLLQAILFQCTASIESSTAEKLLQTKIFICMSAFEQRHHESAFTTSTHFFWQFKFQKLCKGVRWGWHENKIDHKISWNFGKGWAKIDQKWPFLPKKVKICSIQFKSKKSGVRPFFLHFCMNCWCYNLYWLQKKNLILSLCIFLHLK